MIITKKFTNKFTSFSKKDFLNCFWFIKLFKSFFNNEIRCKTCNEKLVNTEYKPYCWDCYYMSLKATSGRAKLFSNAVK